MPFVFVLETGSYYVSSDNMVLTCNARLALNFQQLACLSLLSTRIIDVHHHVRL